MLGTGVATGATGTDFSPMNPLFSVPYFTLPAAGWSGTWQTGDTLSWSTAPADMPVWLSRTVPAGTSPASSSLSPLGLSGFSGA